MTSDGFIFESAQVQPIANQIESLGQEIKNILDVELPSEMEDLQTVWKSNAASAYKSQFETYRAEFVKFYKAIQDMADAINMASTTYNKSDEANTVSGS